MVCLYPLRAYRLGDGTVKVCSQSEVLNGVPLSLPCGRCKGCRLERSRQWAVRCMHEASCFDANCFLTLTYADEHMPEWGSLDRRAFPLFMKRLRKEVGRVRYFHCGEYGARYRRPHYHAIIFGYDFPDKVSVGKRRGYEAYTSRQLEALWPYGLHEIGSVTFESAAYVARYALKKVEEPSAEDPFYLVDLDTGVIEEDRREPEYATMSRRPGIGATWLEKFGREVYDTGRRGVVVRGRLSKPPRFYDLWLGDRDPGLLEEVRYQRELDRALMEEVPLAVVEKILDARLSLLPRELV